MRALACRADCLRILACVAELGLADGWVGAGLVRNAVWDELHGFADPDPPADIDVIYFEPGDTRPEADLELEDALRRRAPGAPWSVKNQARMHVRNGDPPYLSTADAMRFWPETCTAVAARLGPSGVEVLAPLGLSDLVGLEIRPTPGFASKREIFVARLRQKRWLERWPRLRAVDDWPAVTGRD